MKIPRLFRKQKKLQAATRSLPKRAVDEYEEPNMRLSSAFIVVLILHLVAVGGIYAFKSVQTHQAASAVVAAPAVDQTPQKPAADGAGPETAEIVRTTTADTNHDTPRVGEHKTADSPVKPSAKDSGQIYTVVKGDNPVAIAKRFHVNYDELLKLNKIDDPRKLQIGQKLHLPPKTKAG